MPVDEPGIDIFSANDGSTDQASQEKVSPRERDVWWREFLTKTFMSRYVGIITLLTVNNSCHVMLAADPAIPTKR